MWWHAHAHCYLSDTLKNMWWHAHGHCYLPDTVRKMWWQPVTCACTLLTVCQTLFFRNMWWHAHVHCYHGACALLSVSTRIPQRYFRRHLLLIKPKFTAHQPSPPSPSLPPNTNFTGAVAIRISPGISLRHHYTHMLLNTGLVWSYQREKPFFTPGENSKILQYTYNVLSK